MNRTDLARQRTWLRMSYWTAALADFAIAILALALDEPAADRFVIAQGQFAAVAFSWGVFLLMADRKPFERRWVLVPTMLVVAMLGLVSLFSLLADFVTVGRGMPAILASVLVFALLAYSYWITGSSGESAGDTTSAAHSG